MAATGENRWPPAGRTRWPLTGVLMAVSDHAAALPSDRVWQLNAGHLKLMADLTDADLIPLHKAIDGGRGWLTGS